MQNLSFEASIDFVTLSYRVNTRDRATGAFSPALVPIMEPEQRINGEGYYMYEAINEWGRYFIVSFIPVQMNFAYLNMILEVNKVLMPTGKSFVDVLDNAKVSRLDVAYNANIDIASLLVGVSRLQSSGTVNKIMRFYRGPNPSTFYIGSERTTRFCMYDYGYCHRQKGQKIADVIGKITRIELRLKPREHMTLDQNNGGNSRRRKLTLEIAKYIDRLRVYAPEKPVDRGSVMHLFLQGCQQEGYQKMIAEQRKYNPRRAKLIESQLKLLTLDKRKMVRDANQQIKLLVMDLKKAASDVHNTQS